VMLKPNVKQPKFWPYQEATECVKRKNVRRTLPPKAGGFHIGAISGCSIGSPATPSQRGASG
jgi:hypothetical protein